MNTFLNTQKSPEGYKIPDELNFLKGNTARHVSQYRKLIGELEPIETSLSEHKISSYTEDSLTDTEEASALLESDEKAGSTSAISTVEQDIKQEVVREEPVRRRTWHSFKRIVGHFKDKCQLGTLNQVQTHIENLQAPISIDQLLSASTNRAFRRLVKKSLPQNTEGRAQVLNNLQEARLVKKNGDPSKALTLTLEAMAEFSRQRNKWGDAPDLEKEQLQRLSFFEKRTIRNRQSKINSTRQTQSKLGFEQRRIALHLLSEFNGPAFLSEKAFSLYDFLLRGCHLNNTVYEQNRQNLDQVRALASKPDAARYYLG